MQPVRMKTEVPTDLEGIRRMLLGMAPSLEPRQPGITSQLEQANLSQPMMMMGKSGETVTIVFEPQASASATAIKVEVKPPFKPMGKLRQGFWRWRTRLFVKLALKRAKIAVEKDQAKQQPKVDDNGVIQPEVLPPEK